MFRNVKNYLELVRLHMLGLGVQCVVGALTVVGANLPYEAFAPLFAVHALTIAWGFAHNDYSDYEIDRHVPALRNRVIVRGDISRHAALSLTVIIFALSALVTILSWPGLLPISILILLAAFVVAYNRYSKTFAGSDLLFAAGGSLLLILGAVTVLPDQDLRLLPPITWVVVAISFIDHINFNAVLGGIKDVVSDKQHNCNTLACRNIDIDETGKMTISRRFRFAALAGGVAMTALAFWPFFWATYPSSSWQIALCAVFAGLNLYHTYRFVNIDRHDRNVIEKIARQREMAAKSLMLGMLVVWIGLSWTAIVFFVPAVSFAVFNAIMNGHPFRLPEGY